MEIEDHPFELSGWIYCESRDSRLDEFDPHACKIDYPPYDIGKSILERFGVNADLEKREWHIPHCVNPSLLNEIWSAEHNEEREEPRKHGNRISASLEFLKVLCSTLDRQLIFKVQIKRHLRRSHYGRSDDDSGYNPSVSKVYILSANGTLRDERKYYQLR